MSTEEQKQLVELEHMKADLQAIVPTPQNAHNCVKVIRDNFVEYLDKHIKHMKEHIVTDGG